jgi:16S rRNA (uracil1498-N3)-methyltransferase
VRVPRVFTPQPLQPHIEVTLESGASHHLCKVLRMKAGEQLILFNGEGGQYVASLISPDRNRAVAVTGAFDAVDRESGLTLHLGIALSRGDRMDWVVQKATELGVNKISPLETERTGARLDAKRRDKKLRHWRQIVISACEQCGRNRVPRIVEIRRLSDWLQGVSEDARFVLHHRADKMTGEAAAPGSVALLVGPEGGLSRHEVASAHENGFKELSIGPRILRTETAPLAAISILQARWGDMGLPAPR